MSIQFKIHMQLYDLRIQCLFKAKILSAIAVLERDVLIFFLFIGRYLNGDTFPPIGPSPVFQCSVEKLFFFLSLQERLAGVFVELGAEETEAIPFHLLYQHPIIQDCMHMCQRFKTLVSTCYFAVIFSQWKPQLLRQVSLEIKPN